MHDIILIFYSLSSKSRVYRPAGAISAEVESLKIVSNSLLLCLYNWLWYSILLPMLTPYKPRQELLDRHYTSQLSLLGEKDQSRFQKKYTMSLSGFRQKVSNKIMGLKGYLGWNARWAQWAIMMLWYFASLLMKILCGLKIWDL